MAHTKLKLEKEAAVDAVFSVDKCSETLVKIEPTSRSRTQKGTWARLAGECRLTATDRLTNLPSAPTYQVPEPIADTE